MYRLKKQEFVREAICCDPEKQRKEKTIRRSINQVIPVLYCGEQ